MPTAKDCHALTSYYEKQFEKRYGEKPSPNNVNRVTARWNFDSILQSITTPSVKELIDYYLTTHSTNRHSLEWFFYNYNKLYRSMQDGKKDAEHRDKLMQESKLRAEQWRKSGKQGITSN